MASKSKDRKTNPSPTADHQSGKPNKVNLHAAQNDEILIVWTGASTDGLEVDIKSSGAEEIIEVPYEYEDTGS